MTNTTEVVQPDRRKVCVIVGAGPGNGAAFARRFAREGFAVALLARNKTKLEQLSAEIENSRSYLCDASDTESISSTLSTIAEEMGAIDVLIYNAGKGVWGDVLSLDVESFEAALRLNATGAFTAAKTVLPAMLEAKSGTILFVGATASTRGAASTAAFAAAKSAQRSLAQSLARAYGPEGVHVALMVIDAVVGEPVMRERLPNRPDDFFCLPKDIADSAWWIQNQPKSAWTFEFDLRPHGEKW